MHLMGAGQFGRCSFHKIRFGLRNQAREVALMKLFFLDYAVLLVALLMMAYKVFRDPDGDDSE